MDWKQIKFSVDLVEQAVRYLEFLDNADDLEKVLKGEVLKHATCRYEQLWMPFAKKYSNYDIIAPIDIHWVWYLHMLTPIEYRSDCRRNTDLLLNHSFKHPEELIPCLNNTIELWYNEYPKDGFNIIRNGEYVIPIRNKGTVDLKQKSQLSVNLSAAAESQMSFCYQVALPHFRDRKYLESAMNRYKQFLCIKRDHPDEFLTPSVDIMLMWYTHMCSPIAYSKDIIEICGRLLDNDVKVRPSKLIDQSFQAAQQRTRALWNEVSPEALIRPGTKLRPANKKSELFQMTFDELARCCVVVYKLQFTEVNVDGLPESLKHFNLTFYLDNADDTEPSTEVLKLKGPRKIWTYTDRFLYNASYHTNLTIILHKRNKVFCWKGEEDVAMGDVDMKHQVVKKFNEFEIDCELKIQNPRAIQFFGASEKNGIKVNAEYSLESADIQVCDIYLAEIGVFKERPAKGTQFPVPVRGRGKQKAQSFYATHRYTKANRDPCLQCEVIHIPELIYSEVRIMTEEGRLVATSHLIGSSQLPTSSQVEGTDVSMAFDPELGERAMLIRNFRGDWGLCVGHWVNETDSQGYLEVRFMKLATVSRHAGGQKVQRLEVRTAFVEFQSFTAHLGNGHVQINPCQNTIGENLATFWSIAVLHVLCSPHQPSRKLVVSCPLDALSETEPESPGPRQSIEESQCRMLQAAGISAPVPNNEYVLTTYSSLTYDLQMDAQNVVFERMNTNDKLLRKESKRASGDLDGANLVRKLKKKKSSKLELSAKSVKFGTFPAEDNVVEDIVETPQEEKAEVVVAERKEVERQRKKKLRHKVSTLDDALPMSDDSITKDDVAEYKYEEVGKGKKRFVARVSSGLPQDFKPSSEDSSADGDKREALLHVQQAEMKDELSISREHTALVRGIAEKKKKLIIENASNGGGLGERTVTFQIGTGTDPSETATDDTRSDTSSITRETRKMRRERLTKTREELYPLTDEDKALVEGTETQANEDGGESNKKKKKKKKKNYRSSRDNSADTSGTQGTESQIITTVSM